MRTRYFLSGFSRNIPTVRLFGNAIGVFWTSSQKNTDDRRTLFGQACNELRTTGEAVFLTPEGQCIGKFNRGAFHLATALAVEMIPISIHIPDQVDPGSWFRNQNFDTRPGTVDIIFQDPVVISEWTVDQVDQRRREVGAAYAQWTEQYRGYLPK